MNLLLTCAICRNRLAAAPPHKAMSNYTGRVIVRANMCINRSNIRPSQERALNLPKRTDYQQSQRPCGATYEAAKQCGESTIATRLVILQQGYYLKTHSRPTVSVCYARKAVPRGTEHPQWGQEVNKERPRICKDRSWSKADTNILTRVEISRTLG